MNRSSRRRSPGSDRRRPLRGSGRSARGRAGRLLWPVLAGFSRLVIASAGGWMAIHWFGGGLTALFGVMALAFVVFGITVTLAVRSGAWRVAKPPAGEVA